MYLRAEIAKGVRSLTEIKCSIGRSWDKVHKNKSYFILSLLSFDSMSAQKLLLQVGVWVRIFGRTLDKNHPVVKGEFKTCFQFTGSVQVLQEMLLTQGLTRLLLLWKNFCFLVFVRFISPCWINVLLMVHFPFSAGKSIAAGRYWGVCRALHDF